jgi:hypothetical protein
MVRLFGIVVRQLEGRVLFRVQAGLGDAAQFRFADGAEFWINARQCVIDECHNRPIGSEPLDVLRLSFELASYHAQALQEAI